MPSLHADTSVKRKPLFERALDKYLQSLDAKVKNKDFFAQCCNEAKSLDPDEINHLLETNVGERWLKPSTTRKVLRTLAAIQKEYDSVVNTLTSFDPTSISGAVWACVGALANFVDRYFKVSETIADALVALGDDLKRIATYDRLFGTSAILEDVLCQSYVEILHFWNRVFRELHRPRVMKVMSALVPLRSAKLDKIIGNMRTNAERVEKQTKLVQEERTQQEKLERTVRSFLGSPLPAGSTFAVDSRLSGSQSAIAEEQCCDWIFDHSVYQAWRNSETVSRALWVYAPPGSGKSTLCRRVVQLVEKEPSVAVASHFFRFDQNYTTLDVLKSLAAQLWELWASRRHSYSPVEKLARFAADKTSDAASQVLSILHELIQALPTVYFFIDGVDEEVKKGEGSGLDKYHQKNASALGVMDALHRFVESSAEEHGATHLWISSQDVAYTREKFKIYTHLDIKDAVKSGISCYLTSAISDLTVVPPEQRTSILQQLLARAESNFLWAHLMVVKLRKATNLAEMDKALEEGRADDLDAYYETFFDKLLSGDRASISRDIFSLVTFARRPLRIGEIQEAVAILRSTGGRLNSSYKPFLPTLLELFSPLIEVQQDDSEDDDLKKTCQLFHSTLFDFLRRHANLLCEEEGEEEGGKEKDKDSCMNFRVCPLRIADACLLYLSQERYSQLLKRTNGVWVDANEEPVSEHHFVTYCAKNWDKHIDLVAPDGTDLAFSSFTAMAGAFAAVAVRFRARVGAFLSSANFQTCLQIQSLWIDGAFSPYEVRGDKDGLIWLRRSLPSCITLADDTHCRDYHRFWWDWHLFLACADCDDPSCPFRLYPGEIDRCWWGSLGSGNFLSTMQSRYRSYRFESMKDDRESAGWSDFQVALATQDGVKALWLTSISGGQLNFFLETWSYDQDKSPSSHKSQILAVNESTCNASLYAVVGPNGKSLYNVCSSGGTPIASFSDDGQCLRIGTQLYTVDGSGEYRVFAGVVAQEEGYIEEIAGYEGVVAVAGRRLAHTAEVHRRTGEGSGGADDEDGERHSEEDCDDDEIDGSYSGYEEDDTCVGEEGNGDDERDSDDSGEWADSDNNSDSSASGSSSVFDDRGYETCSDTCSSVSDDAPQIETEDESDFDCAHSSCEAEEDTSSSEEDGEGKDHDQRTEDDAESAQEDDDGYAANSDDGLDPSAFVFGQTRPYADQHLSKRRTRGRKDESPGRSAPPAQKRVSIRVSTSEGRLFHFSRKVTSSLSNSPPVLHPIEPLLVWPLGGWEVLFADYEDNTYFVRELFTASSDASNLLMKCRFTKDGRHLHIASFEGRPVAAHGDGDLSMQVTLLVYTYRLCTRKPTRTPPALVHTSQVDLGVFQDSQLSPRLPCTLTWTDTHLYVTWCALTLLVHQIPLFHQKEGKQSRVDVEVRQPKETILLPSSARYRDVFFFPAQDTPFAQIVIGGPVLRERRVVPPTIDLTTPMGCLLHSTDHLGGWVTMENAVKPHRVSGRLNVPLEQFDPDVDCILEPFLWQG